VKLFPGGKFSICPSILLNSREGGTFLLGDKFHPWSPSSPLGANSVVKNGPLRRMEFMVRELARQGIDWLFKKYFKGLLTNKIYVLFDRNCVV
jgi:hypothetical protein